MKQYFSDEYLLYWEQREHENPGLLWFCNRLIDLHEFLQNHPNHVPEFREDDFIIRELNAVEKYAKQGTSGAYLRDRLNRYVKQKDLRQKSQIVTSQNKVGMDARTGNWNEGGYDL